MKKRLLVISLVGFAIFGCHRNPPPPSAQQICHDRWLDTVTAMQVHLQNKPSHADLKALTIDLETFHALNQNLFSGQDETNFTLLDGCLQSANYLNQLHANFDPAHHPEQLDFMLALRPDLKERITSTMRRSYDELYQDIAFNPVIYSIAAREKAGEICSMIKLTASLPSPH